MRTQTWSRYALWRTGLLLGFLGVCACLDEDCVIGVVGRPVALSCHHPELRTMRNVSVEWRRGGEVVLSAVWKEGAVSADALLTGYASLELPAVDLREDRDDYGLYSVSGENQSALLCTVCLRRAASFSSPLLQREETTGEEMAYTCRSGGGFPQPALSWIINDTEDPPQGSVRTLAASLPNTHLYNITSHLTLHGNNVSSVSCVIENRVMNETLTSTSYEVRSSTVVNRASQAMWVFSLGLCVAVGAMVMAAVAYQVHLDRRSKKKKKAFERSIRLSPGDRSHPTGYRKQFLDEAERKATKYETVV